MSARRPDDAAHGRHVLRPHRATGGVGQQLLGHHRDEHIRPRQQRAPQRLGTVDLRAVRQLADASIGVLPSIVAPLAGVVEVLERETDRIDQPMARSAVRAGAMHARAAAAARWPSPAAGSFSRLVSTPGGGCGGGAPSRFSRIHLPRTTGDVRFAADVSVSTLPCPSSPRRGLSAGSEMRRMRAPRTLGNPIVTRQTLVDEREVGVEQIDDAAILLHDGPEQQSPSHAAASAAGCASKSGESGRAFFSSRRIEPLPGEVGDERVRTRVGEHPAHLPLERRRILSTPRRRRSSNSSSGMLLHRKNDSRDARSRSVRRYAAPAAHGGRLALQAEEELRVDQHARERTLDSAIERPDCDPARKNSSRRRHVGRLGATGRRKARVASVERIRRRARLFVRR